jgi:TRAP-type C4-dicarboxylate transport system substrate-binding protein
MTRDRLPCAVGAAAIAIACLTGPAAGADPIVIKYGTHAPPGGTTTVEGIIPWMRAIERESGETVKFQEFWGGQLIRTPEKQYEAMLNGIQDASAIVTSATEKLFPDFGIFTLPMMFRGTGTVEASVSGWRVHEKGLIGGLDKVYVAAIYANDNGTFHLTRTIHSVDDVKGLKIRAAGPGEAEVIKLMGAVPVGMGIPQVAESLNRGVIDGAMTSWGALGLFKITPLIKTHVDLPLGVRAFFLGITKKKFDELPAQAQNAIKSNSGLALSRKLGEGFDHDGLKVRREAEANPNKSIVAPTPAQYREIAAKLKPLHDAWVKEEPGRDKLYSEMQRVLTEMRGGS